MSVEKLIEELDDCRARVGRMCSEGRPPRMCIPPRPDDDDMTIARVCKEAQAALRALVAERRRGEALREAAMPMLEAVIDKHGERSLFDDPSTWNHDAHLHDVTHIYSEVLALRTALTAYDAANPHPPAAEGGSR